MEASDKFNITPSKVSIQALDTKGSLLSMPCSTGRNKFIDTFICMRFLKILLVTRWNSEDELGSSCWIFGRILLIVPLLSVCNKVGNACMTLIFCKSSPFLKILDKTFSKLGYKIIKFYMYKSCHINCGSFGSVTLLEFIILITH